MDCAAKPRNLFTDVEKRFMLAEVIKTSRLDVRVLANFVSEHRIEPNWMQMQLPPGLNMNQCVQAIEGMRILNRLGEKRKLTDIHAEQVAKKIALSSTKNPPVSSTSTKNPPISSTKPKSLKPILPRPSNVLIKAIPEQAPSPPKKRGRPSRAEAASRTGPSQPPYLVPLAPRPEKHTQPPDRVQLAKSGRSSAVNTRAVASPYLAPALRMTPPTRYRISDGLAERKGDAKTQQASSDAGTHADSSVSSYIDPTLSILSTPRTVGEVMEHHRPLRSAVPPGLVPLEPEPRASIPSQEPPYTSRTTLPPIRTRDDHSAPSASPYGAAQTQLASST
ncbi:hypothetical protein G7046_g7190 [Stylonectria norvegica]|nr:hypothetical protein G7046_g7190 [Stylonectria norvegica]